MTSTPRAASQLRGVVPARKPAAIQRWPSAASVRERRADLEQRHVRVTARRVALGGERQCRDRRRPQLVQVRGDRIGQAQRLGVSPNSPASACAMKLKVTHSASP